MSISSLAGNINMPAPTRASVDATPLTTSSKKKSRTTGKSLRSGRPPLLSTAAASPSPLSPGTVTQTRSNAASQTISNSTKKSSKATKALINTHHNLHKSRAKAFAGGKTDLVAQIDDQIAQLGGLQAYQQASLTGQSAERGGDSSALLVKWLQELFSTTISQSTFDTSTSTSTNTSSNGNGNRNGNGNGPRLKVLEVGALSSRNAISRSAARTTDTLIESVKRIDLKSQEPDLIEEIDFMDLPIPSTDEVKYDVLSLSLVLNYVPDARGRGEMLKRTREFLRLRRSHASSLAIAPASSRASTATPAPSSVSPCLFIVLPLPCLRNSRYLNDHRFRELMAVLGYESLKVHQSAKLHYELFRWNGSTHVHDESFRKVEVNPGKGRNNFCITL